MVSNEDLGSDWKTTKQQVRGVDGEVATSIIARCEVAGLTMGLTSGQTRNLFSTAGWISKHPECKVLQTGRGMSIIDGQNREIIGGVLCKDGFVYIEAARLVIALDEYRWTKDIWNTPTNTSVSACPAVAEEPQRDQVVSPMELSPIMIRQDDSLNSDARRRALRAVQMHRIFHAPRSVLQDLVAGNSLDSCDIGIQDFVNAEHLYGPCVICSIVNGVRSAHKTAHVRATRVGERVHIDWFTLPKKGVPGTLLLLDEYSAWVYLIECESKLPGSVILIVEKVLRDFDANNQKSIAEICTFAHLSMQFAISQFQWATTSKNRNKYDLSKNYLLL